MKLTPHNRVTVGPLALALLVTLGAAYGVLAQDGAATADRSIRGQVIDARDGFPLRRARVVVSSGNRQVDQVFTDDEGRFAIAEAPPAALTVRAGKAGYIPAPATVPATRAGAEIQFALARSAAVTGLVVDPNGAPVSDAYVTGRLVLPEPDAAPDTSHRFFTRTNPLGEYRLGSLPAGRYEITAVRIPPGLQRNAGTTLEDQLFGPREPLDRSDRALTMVLGEGDETRNIDFTIMRAEETCATGPSVRPPEGSGTAAIAGRVTSTSGEPLACAIVRFMGPDVPMPQVYTDREGRYAIDSLPAGSFILQARKLDYTELQYGQSHPSGQPIPITVREGERRARVDFVLPRASTISGTVTDEHGEPVEGIGMWAFHVVRTIDGQTSTFSPGLPASTDDRGQYRLTGLRPGTYVVVAMMRGAVGASENGRAYATTYYPGTADASSAWRIALDAGLDADGVNIPLLAPAFTADVSGSVFDSAGRPFTGRLTLSASGRAGALSMGTWSASPGARGTFVFRHVPPGDYVVKAVGPEGSPPQFGMQYVTVVDADPPPLQIVASGGATLEGRVVMEAQGGTNPAGLAVSTAPAHPDYTAVAGARLPMFAQQADGTFRAAGVVGPVRLVLAETTSCEACYLKSASVNGTDAANEPFDVGMKGGVYRDVEIVVSDAGATLEGRVTDERDAPVSTFSLVVIPARRDLWYARSRHLKIVQAGRDGTFRATGLPPGDYLVAAVNRLDGTLSSGGLNDEETLEQLATSPRTERVSVAERQHRTLDLRLIRR